MAPLLELADKYDMESMTKMFLPRITEDWPISLLRWDTNESHIQTLIALDEGIVAKHGEERVRFLDNILVEPCGPIKFGRRFAPNILPSAFYHLSRLEFIDWSQEDDPDNQIGWYQSNNRTANIKLMTMNDWYTLEVGRTSMTNWIRRFGNAGYRWNSQATYPKAPYDITQGKPCQGLETFWKESLQLYIVGFAEPTSVPEPDFLTRTKFILERGRDYYNGAICTECIRSLMWSVAGGREEFWSKLPGFFALTPDRWDDDFL